VPTPESMIHTWKMTNDFIVDRTIFYAYECPNVGIWRSCINLWPKKKQQLLTIYYIWFHFDFVVTTSRSRNSKSQISKWKEFVIFQLFKLVNYDKDSRSDSENKTLEIYMYIDRLIDILCRYINVFEHINHNMNHFYIIYIWKGCYKKLL